MWTCLLIYAMKVFDCNISTKLNKQFWYQNQFDNWFWFSSTVMVIPVILLFVLNLEWDFLLHLDNTEVMVKVYGMMEKKRWGNECYQWRFSQRQLYKCCVGVWRGWNHILDHLRAVTFRTACIRVPEERDGKVTHAEWLMGSQASRDLGRLDTESNECGQYLAPPAQRRGHYHHSNPFLYFNSLTKTSIITFRKEEKKRLAELYVLFKATRAKKQLKHVKGLMVCCHVEALMLFRAAPS